jgi:hypothetical protein
MTSTSKPTGTTNSPEPANPLRPNIVELLACCDLLDEFCQTVSLRLSAFSSSSSPDERSTLRRSLKALLEPKEAA